MSKTYAQYDILDGTAHIYRNTRSGDIWQFRFYVPDENKHYRKSLKTKDFNEAMSKAKDWALELITNIKSGKTIHSITLRELIDLFLEYRKQEICIKTGITHKRWLTIKWQLKWFRKIVGDDTKVSELNKDTVYEYANSRNALKKAEAVTIRNEKSTINNLIKFGYRNGHCHFKQFDFRPITIKADAIGKRDTFKDREVVQVLAKVCVQKSVSR